MAFGEELPRIPISWKRGSQVAKFSSLLLSFLHWARIIISAEIQCKVNNHQMINELINAMKRRRQKNRMRQIVLYCRPWNLFY